MIYLEITPFAIEKSTVIHMALCKYSKVSSPFFNKRKCTHCLRRKYTHKKILTEKYPASQAPFIVDLSKVSDKLVKNYGALQ